MPKLEPCPFCGGEAGFERLGTNRQSCIVVCGNCGCRLESNEEGDFCGESWNSRRLPAPASMPPTDIESTIMTMRREKVLSDSRIEQVARKQTFIITIMVLIAGIQIGLLLWEVYLKRKFGGG